MMRVMAGAIVEPPEAQRGCAVRPSRDGRTDFPLITVWLEVRVLPGPPRTPIRTECSGDSSISPPIGGPVRALGSPVPGTWFWLAFSPLLSLGSANPFLARASRLLQAGSDQPIRPSIAVWRDHSTGASRRRVTPMPRGSRPLIAAFTRSGVPVATGFGRA